MTCVSAATSAAAAQAPNGSPKDNDSRPPLSWSTTTHRAWRSPGTSSAAASTSARTGVTPRVPMISLLVISAPSQCVTSIISWPDSPGNRYLFPPEKPMTSWGNTGPTSSVTSLSTTSRLSRTSIGS